MAIQGRREGVLEFGDARGNVVRRETFTCGHCQHVTEVKHGETLDDLGRFCLACSRPCCRVCATKMANGGLCDPFEEKLARAEAGARLRRQVA